MPDTSDFQVLLASGTPRTITSLGKKLLLQQRVDDAVACFDAALSLQPDFGHAHYWLGNLYYSQRKIEQALACYSRALRFGVEPEQGAQERWMCAMLAGDFESAWRESDRILERRKRLAESCKDKPRHERFVWNGSPLNGKTVLLRCYHGLGDSIQFIRYAPLVRRVAKNLIVQAQPELIPLLRSVRGIDRLISLDDPEPEYEVDIESTELPYAFRTTLTSIPAQIPYLESGPARVKSYQRGRRDDQRLKVGLVWAAGSWKEERSVPVEHLARLNQIPGLALYQLQRGPGFAQLQSAKNVPEVLNIQEQTADVLDTAATLQDMDLVISVDTMVAHLAGALGIQTWTLLHFNSDWRWMMERDDSPWYPTMRLFRQPTPGIGTRPWNR